MTLRFSPTFDPPTPPRHTASKGQTSLKYDVTNFPTKTNVQSYPFMELKCTEERFYLVRVVRDINVHIQYNTA